MKRISRIGVALGCAILFTTLVLFSYQHQAAAQTLPADETDAEGEVVAITPLRLDGQIVLVVTMRVGEDLTVTTPITLDVASWVADLEGSTEITAAVAAVGEPTTTVTGALSTLLTPTLTTTVDVSVTGLITPVLSLVEVVEEIADDDAPDADAEPVQRGEVLFTSNLREGPGTDTAIIGTAQPGDIVVIAGTNDAGDWYNLDDGAWIAGFLVELIDEDAAAEESTAEDAATEDAPADTTEDTTEDTDADADTQESADDSADDAVAPVPTATPAPEAEDEANTEDEADTEDGADAAGQSADPLLDYRVAVITGLLNLASGVEAMGGLMEDPQMLSADWNDSMKLQAEVIRGSYQTISSLSAPDDALAFHTDLLSAMGDCDVAMELLTSGLNSLDMDSLDQAATLMVQCGGKMEDVIATYPEFLE